MRSVLVSWGTEPQHRSAERTWAHIFLGGELPWGARRRSPDSNQLSDYYTLWAHLTNLTLAHSPAARCGASLRRTISALFQHRRLTDKHNDANTTQEFKIRAVEEKALLPGKTLVTALWLSDREREDAVLAVWIKGKVRASHVTEDSNCVNIRSIYVSLTQRAFQRRFLLFLRRDI